MNIWKVILGSLVFIAAAIIWALINSLDYKLGGIGAGLFILAFLYIFSKAIGWDLFKKKP